MDQELINLIRLIIDVNKALTSIAKTQEETNNSLDSIIDLSKCHTDNINELTKRVSELKSIHDTSSSKISEVTAKVEELNKKLTMLTTQLDFKEKLENKENKENKEKTKITFKGVMSGIGTFLQTYFAWLVILIVVILVATGVIKPEIASNLVSGGK